MGLEIHQDGGEESSFLRATKCEGLCEMTNHMDLINKLLESQTTYLYIKKHTNKLLYMEIVFIFCLD